MSLSESQLMDRVRLILGSEPDGVWWRNNTGVATSAAGHTIRYGLGNGSADLVGLFRGRFVAVEIKTAAGRQTEDQQRWQRLVESKRGVYAIVRSEDDARALLYELRRRFP